MRAITVRPSAKINLTLRVGPSRPDGFHEVCTLMQSIGISDRLVVSERRGAFSLQSHTPGVPADETNLVWKAARALWAAAGKTGEPRDAHVRLEKSIPHAAGLGGGYLAANVVSPNEPGVSKLERRMSAAQIAATTAPSEPVRIAGTVAATTNPVAGPPVAAPQQAEPERASAPQASAKPEPQPWPAWEPFALERAWSLSPFLAVY